MKVVSFVNMKGGVAKTTLAVNIADCLVQRYGSKVLVIDIDPQFNATQCLVAPTRYAKELNAGFHTIIDIFDDSPRPVVSTVKGTTTKEPLTISSVKPFQVNSRFHLIPGNLELYRLEMSAGQGRELRLKRYVDHVRDTEQYDFVIIDTPPTPSAWMSSALIASDYYLVPVKPEPLSFTGIDLLRSVVVKTKENFALKLECAGVVLTMAEERTTVYKDAVNFIDRNEFWKGKRFRTSLPKRIKIAKMQGEQQKILDLPSREITLLRAITNITREFVERVK